MIRFTVLFVLISSEMLAQLNAEKLGGLHYNEEISDVWGYVDSNGVEYALVGTQTSNSIVDLSIASNPVEVYKVLGGNSLWRDIKIWGNYAYGIADRGSIGLLIMDLSDLPEPPQFEFWKPTIDLGVNEILEHGHNLYIDEDGFLYLVGSNLGNGRVLIFDVKTENGIPIYIGDVGTNYSHDVFVRDNVLWSAEITEGQFSVWDVSNKTTPVFLASRSTQGGLCHNTWLSSDGNTLFTTDEIGGAYVGAYNVSDISDIDLLDLWRPTDSEGSDATPHNVQIVDDFAVCSYYTEGLKVLDVSRPHNMIEVASYDTSDQPIGGLVGAWGVYAFLPSGLVLIGDINSGLHVIEVDYKRACYFEGVVTNYETGALLKDVQIEFLAHPKIEKTNLLGRFATGFVEAGTYTVTFSKEGFNPKVLSIELENGVLLQKDIELLPLGICDDGVQNGDELAVDCGITCPPCANVVNWPVFTGFQDENETVLSWICLSDLTNFNYELEHSIQQNTWQSLGLISGAGLTLPFEFEKRHERPSSGVNYYRLKLIDPDGNISYSEVIQVRFQGELSTEIVLFPNPISDQVNVLNGEGSIQIYTLSGQLVKSVMVNTYLTTLNLRTLPTGQYVLVVNKDAGQRIVKNIIVK